METDLKKMARQLKDQKGRIQQLERKVSKLRENLDELGAAFNDNMKVLIQNQKNMALALNLLQKPKKKETDTVKLDDAHFTFGG